MKNKVKKDNICKEWLYSREGDNFLPSIVLPIAIVIKRIIDFLTKLLKEQKEEQGK